MLQKEYGISRIFLFGSCARNENDETSDVDIAIETPVSDYFKLYDLKEELEQAFNTRVDLVRLREKMNDALRKRILQEGLRVR